jgi:hypothetical protein
MIWITNCAIQFLVLAIMYILPLRLHDCKQGHYSALVAVPKIQKSSAVLLKSASTKKCYGKRKKKFKVQWESAKITD